MGAQMRAGSLATTILIGLGLLSGSLSSFGTDAAGACGYYVNKAGHEVPRPCGNWRSNQDPPSTATARCRDGAWSSSEHPYASGTCSHHGGVQSYR